MPCKRKLKPPVGPQSQQARAQHQVVFTQEKSPAKIPLAVVFYPCVRWEGHQSGFESSSNCGASGDAGVWKSGKLEIVEYGIFGNGLKKLGFKRLGT